MRRPGMTISFVVHAAALAWALMAISATPMEAPPAVSLPVPARGALPASLQLVAGAGREEYLLAAAATAESAVAR